MLNKLKQICNHPALYLKEEEPQNVVERSMKTKTLMELIENIKDQMKVASSSLNISAWGTC